MSDVPSIQIFHVAIKEVDPLLARTLAEILFWSQKSQHRIDGDLALWKTGPELNKTLGIKARTANEHMKRLAKRGYWRLERRPRPGYGSPSPVTWIIPSEKSLQVLEAASRKTNGARTSNRQPNKPSVAGVGDSQMSVPLTSLQLPCEPAGHGHFNFSPGKANSKETMADPGKNAGEDAKKLVGLFRDHQLTKQLPVWDLSSKFPWLHMDQLGQALVGAGVLREEWLRFVTDIHEHWWIVRNDLPKKFQSYPGNQLAPTSRPLGEEAKLVVARIGQMWAAEVTAKEKAAQPKKKFKF